MVVDKQQPAFDYDWEQILNEHMYSDYPNYKHIRILKKMQKATMPAGWKKNPDFGTKPGVAPFVHDNGDISWKNPASEEIHAIISGEEEKERFSTTTDDNEDKKRSLSEHAQRRFLKKYRMMLKSGVPLKAVEQAARRDGVDPAFLSNPDFREQGKKIVLSPLQEKEEEYVQKYKQMAKMKVPITTIKSMAKRELGRDNVDDILTDLTSAAVEKKNATSEKENAVLFKPCNDGKEVKFTLGTIGKESHLALLVRKMVLTVKRGRYSMKEGTSVLLVDVKDLYNALGALRGVQVARDAYNSTCNNKVEMSQSEVRSKRKPYLELRSSLGIRSPTRHEATVDINGLDQLVAYIEEHFKANLKVINDAMSVGMYYFDSLSEVYKPGTRVVAKNVFASGVDMICEVSWNRYEQGKTLFGETRYFKVCFQFLVAVGDHFTMCEFVEGMENFEGRRHIKGLSFVPLSAHDAATLERLKTTFRQRGEMYANIATGANFMAYDKGSFYAKGGRQGGDKTAALRMAGRVMVDTQGSYEAGHSLSIASNDLMVTGIKYKYKEYMLHMRALKQAKGDSDTTSSDDDGMVLFDKIPTDYLELTWPAVVGFSFTSKTWGEVLVDGLSHIKFDDTVFDSLVLPAARKRMVKALVRHSNDAFNDIISGKGEGSVFLMYGPPGCGKTLTAEAISEMLHRPLYSVSLGQLGITPTELETKLGEILDLCSRWDALILLDEADIFLEKRSSTGSLERNAMVSVMLRLVEYFKGVLFLTSNRVDALDPAFKTRITLALRYDPLGNTARRQVWINLLQSSGFEAFISEGNIRVDELAEHELNGREIKNAIRVAIALAVEDGTPLSQDLLIETIETLNDFNEKMNSFEVY
mmetsp:Transcript_19255/g.28223  ORF Transcript_19255/g.28223 Transcript_19255/m.28223 type:complete len:868 (-) Transcript_19255:164-2767(-)